RREREALEEDVRGNPLADRPLRRRIRNFRPAPDAQIAALGGPLAWMRRLRAIEIELERHEQELAEAYELRESAEEWREHPERRGLKRAHAPDPTPHPALPGRVTAADEPAHWRLRPRERPPVHARAARRRLDLVSFSGGRADLADGFAGRTVPDRVSRNQRPELQPRRRLRDRAQRRGRGRVDPQPSLERDGRRRGPAARAGDRPRRFGVRRRPGQSGGSGGGGGGCRTGHAAGGGGRRQLRLWAPLATR